MIWIVHNLKIYVQINEMECHSQMSHWMSCGFGIFILMEGILEFTGIRVLSQSEVYVQKVTSTITRKSTTKEIPNKA